MRLTAANGIKVILNGQGADETIAGYPSYFNDYWSSLVSAGRIPEAGARSAITRPRTAGADGVCSCDSCGERCSRGWSSTVPAPGEAEPAQAAT